MARSKKKKRILEDAVIHRFVGPLFFAVAVFYLAYHVFNGERGLYAYLKQSRNLETVQTELAQAREKRMEIENRVRLMSDDSLDLDMLDEQARIVLGAAKPGEVVVFPSQISGQ